ncbi:hypothetical protein BJV85_003860 [Clostridium acetobutylicum]|uniref:Uncharacterized protein n=1 Tax=Clostridium acetobutylicum (strain ATCC 824 / DSM 792 / JCM 1419 / IAM 19013 / LMG 5710 / NBRC 13948 / NRRL B-527 / VKM B-1787 / 2291 / W) TaxID=272562 RepID=Q97TS9_CLOAB|nr:Hypothetical protein CA_P0018 [Clostridium acetobutylicum ATCC 824]ADZ22800.1 Conserved hypothetical protein [Clostridium acetobutylicum EA 2018]AEI34760.1 hypothetical protein SMB_P017 [Clostridium acetobutylicum DSM 1731]AWV82309.1 hypothetical protein DK921_19645 [Clostridium acetobutylicum]PSM04346.1 hypothetical protein C7T89_18240 [Clostridium sp. NJ4]
MVLLSIIVFIGVALYEVPALITNKYYKDLTVFSILMFMSLVLVLLYILNLPVPNPLNIITFIVKNLLHLNYK